MSWLASVAAAAAGALAGGAGYAVHRQTLQA